jgi:transcriptional regulator with XRE-family HTH domain
MAKHRYSFPQSITELAEEIGVTRNYLSQVLSRKVPISGWLAKRIDLATKGLVKASDLLGLDNSEEKRRKTKPPLVCFGIKKDGEPYLGISSEIWLDERFRYLKTEQKGFLIDIWMLYSVDRSLPTSKEDIFKLVEEKFGIYNGDTEFFESFFKFTNGQWKPKYTKKQKALR